MNLDTIASRTFQDSLNIQCSFKMFYNISCFQSSPQDDYFTIADRIIHSVTIQDVIFLFVFLNNYSFSYMDMLQYFMFSYPSSTGRYLSFSVTIEDVQCFMLYHIVECSCIGSTGSCYNLTSPIAVYWYSMAPSHPDIFLSIFVAVRFFSQTNHYFFFRKRLMS